MTNLVNKAINTENLPDKNGYFGEYGGAYLPPELEKVMKDVEKAYEEISSDPSFISELKQMEKQLENRLKQSIFARLQTENKAKIMELYRSGDKEGLAILRDTLIGKTELEAEQRRDEAKLTDEQREAYKTIGGVPFLDNQYTVYGEVVEGMDVVEKIEGSKTNKQDRPTENIVILKVERA